MLQSLYDIYKPFVAPFLTTITQDLFEPLSAVQQSTTFYTHRMNVSSWLSGAIPGPRPPTAYLATVPVSFTLIGLTQLVQYLIVRRVSGLSPGDLRDRMAGATDHSQGIISAVAIAVSLTLKSFVENVWKAVTWLFVSGLRGQEVFPVASLEPSIVQDEGGEGATTSKLT
jgi:fatty acid synthase subunit beta